MLHCYIQKLVKIVLVVFNKNMNVSQKCLRNTEDNRWMNSTNRNRSTECLIRPTTVYKSPTTIYMCSQTLFNLLKTEKSPSKYENINVTCCNMIYSLLYKSYCLVKQWFFIKKKRNNEQNFICILTFISWCLTDTINWELSF